MENLLGMANMFFHKISDSHSYALLLAERKCIAHRPYCNRACENCEYNQDAVDLLKAIDYALDVLKARSPELHLISDFQQILNLSEKCNPNHNQEEVDDV